MKTFRILGKRGRITVPYEIRCKVGFKQNDLLSFEESKLNGMQGNRRIGKDIIAGPFFIVGNNGDEFRSLTDEETKESLKRFAEPEEISQEEVENAMSAGIMFFG